MKIINLILCIILLAISSCRHAKVRSITPPSPEDKQVRSEEKELSFENLKIALVLGGLDARGFANIGVLRGLEKQHIFPSQIIASGMGAITGALYCAERNSFALEWKHYKLTKEIYFDFSFFGNKTGKVAPGKIISFLKENIKTKNLSDLSLPLTLAVTDLTTGKNLTFKSGSIPELVYASLAVPGVFVPMRWAKWRLVSSYIKGGLPIETALNDQSLDAIIVVDLDNRLNEYPPDDITEISIKSLQITSQAFIKQYNNNPKIFILRPDLESIKPMDFENKRIIMKKGIEAVEDASNELKTFLMGRMKGV